MKLEVTLCLSLGLLVAGCPTSTTIVQGNCGPGTTREGEICFGVDAGGLRCGVGTVEVAGVCVLAGTDAGSTHPGDAGPSLVCGAGTHESVGECVPDMTGPACGIGTHPSGGTCVPDEDPVCGAGTHVENHECVPDGDPGLGYFDVRVASATINADGFSDIPVFVIGRDATGVPYTGDVVLLASRASAGSLEDSTPTLTSVGATTYFTPCVASATGCLGTFEISLSLPTDPGTVLATTGPLTLITSSDVGTLAPCSGGGNVAYFDGDSGDFIFPGRHTLRTGTWSISGGPATGVDLVHIQLDSTDFDNWDLEFSSRATGVPLHEGVVYENAERLPFASTGHPGIEVTGRGAGCNQITGRFQVHRLVVTAGTVTGAAITFEQHCEGASPALRGCVSYGL